MKKIFFSLFFLIFLLFPKNVSAFEFVKSTNNPLNVNYIEGYTYQLQHHIFKEDQIFKGIFVIKRATESYYSLGYFESIDGIDWQMKKEILNTGEDLSNPSILKTDNGYLLFISRYDNNTVYRIYSSICDDDFNCSPNLIMVINPVLTNSSEKNGVFAGHPYVQSNRTYMFFGAWGTDGFKLKTAYSDDLVNWERCPNGFLYGGDGPFLYENNGELYLFFHRSDSTGIKVAKTTLPLTCDSVFIDQGYLLTKDKSYDQNHLIFPSLVSRDNGLGLYYSGLGSDGSWKFNLANTGTGNPSPTETQIPTPTTIIPTPTTGSGNPTPTIVPGLQPIIIIPGFFASWNRESILHNIPQPQSNWKVNPVVNEYGGVIQTLKNLGYIENKDLFIFAYDWRKPILEIAQDLNSYITNLQISNFQFTIIGHSLGGLVGRIYSQKYNNQSLNKLITVGSPHYGVAQMYKVVEAGEVERFNDFMWLTVKIILMLNKNNIETDKQTISKLFPITKDLFPVYNFLKKNGKEIKVEDMKIKNDFLISYNSNLSNWSNKSHLFSIIGEKNETLKGFYVTGQNYFDKIFGNYIDGHPTTSFSQIGDNTVISTSAKIEPSSSLKLDHGELIYKKDGIRKILDLLDIHYSSSQIIEGQGTVIDSSLIFLIKSPATMEVTYAGKKYLEHDGVIFITNAKDGKYQLKVKGISYGTYEVVVGQIGHRDDIWDHLYGEVKKTGQIDSYDINFNRNNPKSYFHGRNKTEREKEYERKCLSHRK